MPPMDDTTKKSPMRAFKAASQQTPAQFEPLQSLQASGLEAPHSDQATGQSWRKPAETEG